MAAKNKKQDKQQRLLQLIECPVCLNELQDPRLLSCRHALCHMCLKDYKDKNKYNKNLPCPVCRELTTLYEGGVDNLPKFFFMNELKEVVLEKDVTTEEMPQKRRRVSCSSEDCEMSAVKFCTKGCDFLCELCYEEHKNSRFTKSHQVIVASDGEVFTKSKQPNLPPCHRHKHQVMDLYCRTCDVPLCTTCCQINHQGHACIEIERQAEVCKSKLANMAGKIDGLLHQVKHAVSKTKCRAQEADKNIDDMCDNVRATFKKIHDKLSEEESKILLDLQGARTRMQTTSSGIVDDQNKAMVSLEGLRACEAKLSAKDSIYDYVTVTDSLQRDVEIQLSEELPMFRWSAMKCTQKGKSLWKRKQGQVNVMVTEDRYRNPVVRQVNKIRLQAQDQGGVFGMATYKKRVYIVHNTGLTIYSYTPDGSLSETFEYESDETTHVERICLMMDGDSAMLVVSVMSCQEASGLD